MPWGRVDDTHYDHPKVIRLPRETRNEALGLYWRAISYSNAKLTDGFIDHAIVVYLDGSEALAKALVKARLWHRRGREGYVIHDFNGYNKSRQQVETERQQRVEAGRIGGLAKARSRTKSAAPSARVADAKQAASKPLADGKQKSTPSRPVPVPGPLENGGSGNPGSSDAGAMAPIGALLPVVVPSRARTTTTTTDGEQR